MRIIYTALIITSLLYSCKKSTDNASVDPTLNTLAFTRQNAANRTVDIYSSKEDGTNVYRVTTIGTETRAVTLYPSWGPSGKIYFTLSDDINPKLPQIYSVNSDGSNLTQVTNNLTPRTYHNFSVTRAAERFLYIEGDSLLTSKLDGTDEKVVVGKNVIEATWHPDGRRIVYVDLVDTVGFTYTAHLFIVNADGTNRQQISTQPRNFRYVHVSPDGNRLCYTANQVFVSNLDGTQEQDVTRGMVGTTAGWSSDGQKLYVFMIPYRLVSIKPDFTDMVVLWSGFYLHTQISVKY